MRVDRALFVPRSLASPTVREFAGTSAISLVIGPTVMIWQGMSFPLGAFGTRWFPRGAWSNAFDGAQMLRIARTLLPISILGLLPWRTGHAAPRTTWAGVFMHLTILGMVVPPVAAVLLSRPLAGRRRSEERIDASAVGTSASPAAT